MEFTKEIQNALGAAFAEDEIEFLPKATSNGKALGLPYIDARAVMNRLDAVVGAGNWSFDFDIQSGDGKMVKGRLRVCGIEKCDAGEAATEDEILKSAVSDALKRCAVHFGIGRYLYYLPRVWAPYDAAKRRFTEAPRIEQRAIDYALRQCGITGRGGQPPRPERTAQAEQPKSVWSASGNPETLGDRAATAGQARTQQSVQGAEKSNAYAFETGARPAEPTIHEPENLTMSGGGLFCANDECAATLTAGQHALSLKSYGQPLCPRCQKTHAKAA